MVGTRGCNFLNINKFVCKIIKKIAFLRQQLSSTQVQIKNLSEEVQAVNKT